MELISKDEAMRILKEDLDASKSRGDDERADACFLHYIEISNLPTIEERKEGRWIEKSVMWCDDPAFECSICGEEIELIEGTPKSHGMNYCTNCGAKMERSE